MNSVSDIVKFACELERLCDKYNLCCYVAFKARAGYILHDSISIAKQLDKQTLKCKSCYFYIPTIQLRFYTLALPPLDSLEHAIVDAQLESLFA